MNTRFNIQFLVTDYQDQETEGPGETVEETSGRVTGTGKQMTQVHDSYIIIIIIILCIFLSFLLFQSCLFQGTLILGCEVFSLFFILYLCSTECGKSLCK